MFKEPSMIEEDYPPTGGFGYLAPEHNDVLYDLAQGKRGVEIMQVSAFGGLPLLVALEIIQQVAANNDGNLKRSREYLLDIISENF